MPTAILDAWATAFSLDDTERTFHLRIEAIAEFLNEMDSRALQPIRTMPESRLEVLYEQQRRTGLRADYRLFSNLLHEDHDGAPVAEVIEPPEPLCEQWLAQLHISLPPNDPTRWRNPVLISPDDREPAWTGASVRFRTAEQDEDFERVLGVLESLPEHEHFERDYDPWIYQGNQLPKPPGIAGSRMESWQESLTTIRPARPTRETEKGELYWFVPSPDWDPLALTRDDWRSRRVFGPLGDVPYMRSRLPITKGPVDFRGDIWLWHDSENHWDVQVGPKAGYFRVHPDGAFGGWNN